MILGHVLDGDVKASPQRWRCLHQKCGGWTDFAAQRKSLQQAKADQKNRGRHTDLSIGRGKREPENGRAHQGEGKHHRRLAANPIAVNPDDHATERPGQKADTETRQGIEQSMRRPGLGKKAVADLDGKEGESEEIIEFQPIAHAHRDYFSQRQVLLFERPFCLFIRERCVHPPPVGSTEFICRGELSSCTIAQLPMRGSYAAKSRSSGCHCSSPAVIRSATTEPGVALLLHGFRTTRKP